MFFYSNMLSNCLMGTLVRNGWLRTPFDHFETQLVLLQRKGKLALKKIFIQTIQNNYDVYFVTTQHSCDGAQ